MAIWRKEEDKENGKTVFHCDEHDFHTSEGSELESHLLAHDLCAASFWGRKHDHNLGTLVYTCPDHNFSTRNAFELKEHERFHAELAGMPFAGW